MSNEFKGGGDHDLFQSELDKLNELVNSKNKVTKATLRAKFTVIKKLATALVDASKKHHSAINDVKSRLRALEGRTVTSGRSPISEALKPVPYAGTEKDVAVSDFLDAAFVYVDELRCPDSKLWSVMSNSLTKGAARDLLLSSKAVIEALPASERRAKIAEVLKQRFAQSETNKVYQARRKLRDLRQDGRPAIQYFRELDGLRADIPSLTNGELCFVAVQGLDADVERQVTLQLGLGSNDYQAIEKAAVAADANLRKAGSKRTIPLHDTAYVSGQEEGGSDYDEPVAPGKKHKAYDTKIAALQYKVSVRGGPARSENEIRDALRGGLCLMCLKQGHTMYECPNV